VSILREHLVEHVPVSDVCDKHQIQPTLYYHWQKIFFGKGGVPLAACRPLKTLVNSSL
jgi:transposase-like protein